MSEYGWAFLAALLAVTLEALYRSGRPFVSLLLPLIPLTLLLQYALYRLQGATDSLLTATAAFGASTMALRIIFVLCFLREPVNARNWTIFGLMVGLVVLKGLWK